MTPLDRKPARSRVESKTIFSSDSKPKLSTGAIIGIAFAAALAALLLISVLIAIFVPGIRYIVATNSVKTNTPPRSTLGGQGRSATNISSDGGKGAHSPSASPRAKQAGNEQEVPLGPVRAKAGEKAKKPVVPSNSSSDESDSNYDSE